MEEHAHVPYNGSMELPPEINYANLCKEIRIKGKFTQAEMAKKIGVSLSTYCYWEYGKTIPNGRNAAKLFLTRENLNSRKKL